MPVNTKLRHNELAYPIEYLCVGTDLYTDKVGISMRGLYEALSSRHLDPYMQEMCKNYPGLEYWMSTYWLGKAATVTYYEEAKVYI